MNMCVALNQQNKINESLDHINTDNIDIKT